MPVFLSAHCSPRGVVGGQPIVKFPNGLFTAARSAMYRAISWRDGGPGRHLPAPYTIYPVHTLSGVKEAFQAASRKVILHYMVLVVGFQLSIVWRASVSRAMVVFGGVFVV